MTDTDRYYININSKSFMITNIPSAIFVIYIFGGFSIFSIAYYLIMIYINASRYLFLDKSTFNKYDSLNGLLILPFSREDIYKTYI